MNQFKNVNQVITMIKNSLEGSFRNLMIEGEITNLSGSGSGHWYFSLRDSNAILSCALFKMDAMRNPVIRTLKDGDKIRCAGSISVYSKRGTFQLLVKQIAKVGKGELKEEFEKLKRKLAAEGLFDIDKKKKIPLYPKRVAVITAKTGAALQDFLNIQKRKSLWMDTVVIPALVQGDAAPNSIRKALHNAIKYSLDNPDLKFDVIVLTRGGGSLEDLWAFNDEGLAYDIFNCPIPTISAVGHQVDYSICDFVADKRVETPSAAAETLSHPQELIIQRIQNSKRSLFTQAELLMGRNNTKLKASSPKVILDKISNNILNYHRRIEAINPIERSHQYTRLHEYTLAVDESHTKLQHLLSHHLVEKAHKVDKLDDKLNLINPKAILKRGYTYIEDEKGHVIADVKSFKKLDKDSKMTLNFHDGEGIVCK